MTTLHQKYFNFILIALCNANAIGHDTLNLENFTDDYYVYYYDYVYYYYPYYDSNRFIEDYEVLTFKEKEFRVSYDAIMMDILT